MKEKKGPMAAATSAPQRFGAEDVASLKQRIRMLRKARGWSVQRFAKESGLSVIAIRGLESGKADPRLRSALAIAEALGEPIDRLIASARAASVSVRLVRIEDLSSPPPGRVWAADVTGELHEARMVAEVLLLGVAGVLNVPKGLNDRPTFCYVLNGSVTVKFRDGDARRLHEGDAIHFVNEGKGEIANSHRDTSKVLRVIDLISNVSPLYKGNGTDHQ